MNFYSASERDPHGDSLATLVRLVPCSSVPNSSPRDGTFDLGASLLYRAALESQ